MTELLKSKKVLVADNSPVMTKIIMNNLLELGFAKDNIFVSNTGNQVSMMLDLECFDLMTSGLHISQKDGIEILSEIRQNPDESKRQLPFLIITAERDDNLIKRITDLGGNGYINKPFTKAQISNAIRKIFQDELGDSQEDEITASTPKTASQSTSELAIAPKIIQPFIDSTLEAIGQYMVTAEPTSPVAANDFRGFFSASVELSDAKNSILLTLILNFPKKLACDIYEGIFGEVDLEQVCEVVKELVNIIGGAIKPKLGEVSAEVICLLSPETNSAGTTLDLKLGLPSGKMGEEHNLNVEDEEALRFTVPFNVQGEQFTLTTVFQKR